MAFEPFVFTYTPPATVSVPNSTSYKSSVLITKTIAPLASAAIVNLNNLIDTSLYLQNLIVSKYSNMGVNIDPAKDPATATSLAAVYNGTTPPIVTTAMYSNLLDCQFALQAIDQTLGNNSIGEADPYMLANVTQINNAVLSSLLVDGGSDQVLIQSLSLLKGDAILFSGLATNLKVYQGSTDLGPSVSSNINTLINNTMSLYASTESLLISANVINADINNVLTSYVNQSTQDIVAITAAIHLLYSTSHKPAVSSIFNGLTSLVYTRLLSEVSVSYFASDQLVQRLLAPLKVMSGTAGILINSVSSSIQTLEVSKNLAKTTVSNITKPVIPGFSNCNPCSSSILNGLSGTQVPKIPSSLQKISAGNQFLAQHISAAMAKIESEFNQSESSFIALQKRRNSDTATILQLTCAMQAAESLIAIGNSLISTSRSTTSSTPILAPITLAALSTSAAITQTNTATASSVSSASGTIKVPVNVQAVLNQGAINNLHGVTNG